MKDAYYFYITLNRPQNGYQSNHVGVICVVPDLYGFRVGLARKHPQDAFKCKEGCRLAREDALGKSSVVSSFRDVKDCVEILLKTFYPKVDLVMPIGDFARRVVYVLAMCVPVAEYEIL